MKTKPNMNNAQCGLLSVRPGGRVARSCAALLAGAALWLTALSPTQAATYRLDNGSIATALNASEGTEPLDNWFGNVFTAQAGANIITRVDFGVFTTTPGSSASVVLYLVTDPGGNPALGATRVYTQDFTPLTGDNTNSFLQQIPLTTPVNLNTGDRFLVAVMIRNVIGAPPNDVYPYLLDTSGVATGTYWDRSAPNTFNLDNLSQAKLVNQPLTPGGFVPGNGHIFIRATGVATPQPSTIQLSPASATNLVGTAHTVCAAVTIVGSNGVPVVGTTVTFNVTNGPNATVHGTSVTDSNGVACFTYVGTGGVGTDIIDASFVGADGNRHSDFATKIWVNSNNSPVAKCKNLTVSADDNCQGAGSVDDGSFDPDQGDVITVVQIPPGPYSLGTNLVTLLVTDSHGASNACTATVVVVDTTPPAINCPTNIVVGNDPGQCSAVVNFTVTATDNCAGPTVTVDPSHGWIGYMNVFALPSSGNYPPSLGSYQFGSGWGTADLVAYFTGSVLTLSPNTVGDPNPYWYTPSGGPGSVGNKIMDANMYVEPPAGTLAGINLTFTGTVLANTLVGNVDARTNGWTSVAFIKDFAPDYSSFNTVTAPLVNGVFSITLATVNDPARHVQYGFETIGPDVWVTDVAPFGSIQVGPATTFPTVTCDPPSGSVFPKGTTTVLCTATDAAGNINTCSFDVTVEDREAPVAACREGVNPSGKKIPVAGKNPSSGQNPDGFYQLLSKDNCDANPAVYVADTGSAFIAGPFHSGDIIKLTQSPGKTPSQDPAPAPIVAHIHLKGDGLLYAVDADGNISEAQLCLVPRPPK